MKTQGMWLKNKSTPTKMGCQGPSPSLNTDNILNNVHFKPPKMREYDMDGRTQLEELHNTMKIKWRSKVEILHDYISYQARRLARQSKLQHMWDGHLGRLKAAKHQTKLILCD